MLNAQRVRRSELPARLTVTGLNAGNRRGGMAPYLARLGHNDDSPRNEHLFLPRSYPYNTYNTSSDRYPYNAVRFLKIQFNRLMTTSVIIAVIAASAPARPT